MNFRIRSIAIVLHALVFGLYTLRSAAAEPQRDSETRTPPAKRKVDFVRDVEPILSSRCYGCHGPETQEAQLRLDSKRIVLTGGVSGPAIIPGRSADSLLVQRIAGLGDLDRMPLDDEPLSDKQIGLIRAWIDQGASWPPGADVDVDEVEKHWAYVTPVRPASPPVGNPGWVRNPIDMFVLSRLEREDLAPSREAEKSVLIRRVTLDLTGLPPTLAEIDAFLADASPRAYEKLVDRLLASPRYGERWAIPWLDAARHADSNGYQRDGRRESWPYRDWVIRALNGDMPFDRFTIEQIAGDLLPEPTRQQLVATGFHRGTMANVEAGTDPQEEHVLAVIDRVNTTGAVWLGSTIECAQCHNHKYDPFTQQDYYRLYAFFNNTEREIASFSGESRREFIGPKIELPLPPETKSRREQIEVDVDRLKEKVAAMTEQLKALQTAWEREVAAALASGERDVPEAIVRILGIEPDNRNNKQKQQLTEHYLSQSDELATLNKQLERAQAQYDKTAPTTALVMQERPEPRETRVFKRGDFLNPGRRVDAGTPAVLHPLPADVPRDRLALACWLVDEDNPLVARVAVNRHWQEFFGRGIVETPEDFGTQGEPPTHPQLLDWLATEFVRRDWSMKSLHRLIVTSATYRQSSRVAPELLRSDPYNALYSRGPRFRMKAEIIRDNALAVAGLLSDKMHGPPVFPYQPPGVWNHTGRASNVWPSSQGDDKYRRGLYVYWRRTVPYPSFVNFDAPSRETCSVKRSRSNTPLQALTLLNDPVFFEAAVALAERMVTEPGEVASIEERVTHGFRLATARRPDSAETRILASRFRTERGRYLSETEAAAELLSEWTVPAGAQPAEFAAWVHVANVILNLDEVITKG